MDFIGPAYEFVIAPLLRPLFRRIKYANVLEKNLEKLKKELEDLNTLREDVKEEIDRDTTFKVPTNECRKWLEGVEKIQSQCNDIERELTNMRCCSGRCPDILLRMKLGELIVAKLNNVIQLQKDSAFRGGVVVDKHQATVEITPTPNLVGQQTIQELLRCIEDENVGKIGVWGMGGVGKTTVMKQLGNLPEISQMFEIVIWVTVSSAWTSRKMQNNIAESLKIRWMDISSNERLASHIFQKLKSMKYLLLLDDLWDKIILEELGVPHPTRENGCKIVITSRYLNVCKAMGNDKDIKVVPLSKEEAWDLFHKSVGEVINMPEIKEQARRVVEECQGLPLAIVVIGSSLRKEDSAHVWRNVVQELRAATFEIGDMEEVVFKKLKFSYERLRNDSTKNCFLYCALYPEDYLIGISNLLEYWRAEGFIENMQNLQKEYDKGHRMLNELISSSLLEKVDELHIKMHDVIRDLALRITSSNGDGPRFFVRVGGRTKDCLNKEEWEHAKRISLMNNYISKLPESPQCTSLSTLFLQGNHILETIPELFFQHMCVLQVLDMSQTFLQTIPSSISNLVSLRALYIEGCNMIILPSEVGALKGLEVLHLSSISYLPIELRELTRLRSLHVTFCGAPPDQSQARKKMICDGIISSLCLLEDFNLNVQEDILSMLDICFSEEMSNSGFPKVEDIVGKWKDNVDVVVEEMDCLRLLASLKFFFPIVKPLELFIKSKLWKHQHLTSFEFLVGKMCLPWFIPSKCNHENQKSLVWNGGDGIPNAIEIILNEACTFELRSHSTIQKFSELGVTNLRRLHNCSVGDCSKLEMIIEGDPLMSNVYFPNLEVLHLLSLCNLRSICEGPLPPNNFFALRCLELSYCTKIRNIFSLSVVHHFSSLEELQIQYCDEVEEIVKEGDEIDEDILFPRLKELILTGLPKLVKICKNMSHNWPSLRLIRILECLNLKTLPFSKTHKITNMEEIYGENEWWEELEWEDDETKVQLQPCFQAFRCIYDDEDIEEDKFN